MTLHEISRRAQGQHAGVKLVVVLLLTGVMIEMVALIVGIALGVSTGDYFSETKATRDAATSGSGLLSQIGTISAVKGWLVPLQFLGGRMRFGHDRVRAQMERLSSEAAVAALRCAGFDRRRRRRARPPHRRAGAARVSAPILP